MVVALIPARGGSRSIPRKNIRHLNGIPLIAYSIEAGLRARTVDRVIVSTDDAEIADVATQFGAEVPFMRPAALAEDHTTDYPVLLHAVRWLEEHDGQRPEIVVQLRPTSPLRPPDCVDRAVALLQSDPTTHSVRGVVPSGQNPYKMWRLQPDGLMSPLLDHTEPEAYNLPRQVLPETRWQTGHIDAIRSSTLVDLGSVSGSRIRALEIDPIYTCDIDTEFDWRRTEWMLEHLHLPRVRPQGPRDPFPADVRLVVFDFDGVLTDNRVWVATGGAEWVACNRSDGQGLAKLRRLGIDLFVLSTETNPVVADRCRKLALEHEHGVADKGARLRTLLAERGLQAEQVVYVGNDINDLDCFRIAGCAVAVADAHPEVMPDVDLVLTRPGGHGAVRELCDRLHAHVLNSRAIARSTEVLA